MWAVISVQARRSAVCDKRSSIRTAALLHTWLRAYTGTCLGIYGYASLCYKRPLAHQSRGTG